MRWPGAPAPNNACFDSAFCCCDASVWCRTLFGRMTPSMPYEPRAGTSCHCNSYGPHSAFHYSCTATACCTRASPVLSLVLSLLSPASACLGNSCNNQHTSINVGTTTIVVYSTCRQTSCTRSIIQVGPVWCHGRSPCRRKEVFVDRHQPIPCKALGRHHHLLIRVGIGHAPVEECSAKSKLL